MLLFCASLYSCVEVYEVRYTLKADVVTVEGFVTNDTGLTVILKTSRSRGQNYFAEPLKKCTVEIGLGNGTSIPLTEVFDGGYAAPSSFRGQIGQTYQLRFRTPDGRNYESETERLNAPPAIAKSYFQFNQNGILDRTGTRVLASSFDVFVDFNDPAEQRNFYLWRWVSYEEQRICASCEGGRLDSRTKLCVPERNSRITYDYVCDAPCWEMFFSNEVNIFSDAFSNGRSVVGRQVAKIPFYRLGTMFENRACLIEIQQYTISAGAYEYYRLLRDQAQNTGNLTDTPPAAIIGNVRNVNDPSEEVVGYFGTAGVVTSRLFIDKRPFRNATPVFMLGRDPNLEPDSQPMPPLFDVRPPFAPCLLSASRTPVKPIGWNL
ncbi:MAG: DUF4249 domain-containing protein [Runella sp.]